MTRNSVVASAAVLFVVLAAGCGGGRGAALTAKAAPDFTLPNVTGTKVTLSSFRGKSNVLVHFGATWCPPCIREIPELIELAGKYGPEQLVILSIDVRETPELVSKFAVDHGINYVTLLDEKGLTADAYGVTGIPDNFLVDREGIIRSRSIELPAKEIASLVGG